MILIDDENEVMACKQERSIVLPNTEIPEKKRPEKIAEDFVDELGFRDISLRNVGYDGFGSVYFSSRVTRRDKPGYTWINPDKLSELHEKMAAKEAAKRTRKRRK